MPGSPQNRPPNRGGKPFAMPPPQQGSQPNPGMNKMIPGQYPPQGPQGGPMHPHHPQHPHHPHHIQQGMQNQPHPTQQQVHQAGIIPKRDLVFPKDSIESTTPVLYRRKRMTKADIGPTDPWRLFMALRSGLLAETTWALDVLNVLLFDDSAVAYFGLLHMPGLLNLLLEHFQKSLADMFNEKPATKCDSSCNNDEEVDLGAVRDIPNPEERVLVFKATANYTMQTRKGVPVKVQDASNDIFVTSSQKSWDKWASKGYCITNSANEDPWAISTDPTVDHTHDYIMDCFQAEFKTIPFARSLKGGRAHCPSDTKDNKVRRSPAKVMRMNEETDDALFAPAPLAVVKKEPEDSDCREVDMELERLPNGPASESAVKEEILETFDLKTTVKDPARVLKRRRMSDYEDECYTRDEPSLFLITDTNDALARRCICLSTILRNLTFVPGNELEFARSPVFLAILGEFPNNLLETMNDNFILYLNF